MSQAVANQHYELVFEEDLKKALSEYYNLLEKMKPIKEQLDPLDQSKEDIREKLRKWMEINNLQEYEGRDFGDILWRITNTPTEVTVINYDYLKEVLTDEQYANAITKQPGRATLRAQPVKKKKTNRPSAPKSIGNP